MSSKRRHEIVDVVFEMLGGTERLHAVAETDPQWFYDRLWARGLPKANTTEHGVSEGVESLLDRLDQQERVEKAKTIDGSFVEVLRAVEV